MKKVIIRLSIFVLVTVLTTGCNDLKQVQSERPRAKTEEEIKKENKIEVTKKEEKEAKKIYSKEEILDKERCIEGKLINVYRVNKKIVNQNRRILHLNVVSIKREDEYTIKQKKFEHIIAIETAYLLNDCIDFIKKGGYFFLVDENRESTSDIDIYVDKVGDSVYIILDVLEEEELKYKYLCIGGLDREFYGKDKVLFELD